MSDKPLTLVEALTQKVGVKMHTQLQSKPPITLTDLINRTLVLYYVNNLRPNEDPSIFFLNLLENKFKIQRSKILDMKITRDPKHWIAFFILESELAVDTLMYFYQSNMDDCLCKIKKAQYVLQEGANKARENAGLATQLTTDCLEDFNIVYPISHQSTSELFLRYPHLSPMVPQNFDLPTSNSLLNINHISHNQISTIGDLNPVGTTWNLFQHVENTINQHQNNIFSQK